MQIEERVAPVVTATHDTPGVTMQPAPVTAVRLGGGLLGRRVTANREVSIPAILHQLETTQRIDNFRRGAKELDGPFYGLYFNDTDLHKWLEAVSWSLATHPDPELEAIADDLIALVGRAQLPDGYVDNFYTAGEFEKRWQELWRTHELYVAGHLIQAAVAHHRATGKDSLLTIGRRFADLICATLGPADEGKQPGTDGHPEIETALVELYRETGDRKYLDEAQYLIDARGHGLAHGDAYRQDHVPARELDEATGHAVRLLYLAAGVADVYAETGETALKTALDRWWDSAVLRRMYITGGMGARHDGEAFGDDYELPNSRAYTETCAAIASIHWNWRMLLLTGETRYADLLEWTLYNGFLPGVSLDGREFFYVNPLADDGRHRRVEWFECACCPPNVARMLASLSGYFVTTTADTLLVHLYDACEIAVTLGNGTEVSLSIETAYPRAGEIRIVNRTAGDYTLALRVPAWCQTGAAITINGEAWAGPVTPGSYARVTRSWTAGDEIVLTLPPTIQLVEPHPYLAENRDSLAITRGALLYCLEEVDNPGVDPRDLRLPVDATFAEIAPPPGLGDAPALQCTVDVAPPAAGWQTTLYRVASPATETTSETATRTVTAIPYAEWANRAPGWMTVWLQRAR